MNVPHAQSWRQSQEANRRAAQANAVYGDDLEPKCDRSSLRAKWLAATAALGNKWLLAEPIRRAA